MTKLALYAAVILFSLPAHLSGEQSQVDGCISQAPGGGFQFEASPSRIMFPLQGEASRLAQHVDQFVHISGSLPASGEQRATTLKVQRVDVISESCTSPQPVEPPVAVVGKVGEDQVAVPVTSSASAGQTTPGFQTETITDQGPPNDGRPRPPSAGVVSTPYSPANTAQAAQSSADAEVFAAAATRSEIQPGNTLGTNLQRPARINQSSTSSNAAQQQ